MKFYTNFFKRGNKLYVRGYTEGGVQVQNDYDVRPTLYTEIKPNGCTDEPMLNMFDEQVWPNHFNTMREARDFINSYRGSGMKIWGYPHFEYAKINELFNEDIEASFSDIKSVSIDIETMVAGPDDLTMDTFPNIFVPRNPINLITISYNKKQYFTFGYKEFNPLDVRPKNETYVLCKDEADMLSRFVTFFKQINPDVITGWNISGFDIPYLYNRIKTVLNENVANSLSPFGWVSVRETNFKGKVELDVNIYGITILDYLELYKKFELSPRENYKLDVIAEIELGEKKVEYDCSFRELYENHWDEKFVPYNIQDVKLIDKLDDKLGFIELAMNIAHLSKCNFTDVYRVTRIWDNIVANYMVSQGKHVITDYSHFGSTYEGAYVKPTIAGIYDWIASFDVSSLYPSMIIQYNISPDTILPAHTFFNITPDDIIERNERWKIANAYAKEHDVTLCANGSMYRKDKQGFIPHLIDNVMKQRKESQRLMRSTRHDLEEYKTKTDNLDKAKISKMEEVIKLADKRQHALKILANSFYGCLGTQYFRHYNIHMAEAITLSGQVVVHTSYEVGNKFINGVLKTNKDYVVASDTDSAYFNITDLVNKVIPKDFSYTRKVDAICKITDEVMYEKLEAEFDILADDTNAYLQRVDMERENIGSACFVAKKNYVMKVYDSEGTRYATPKLKLTGLEAVKAATPGYFRQKLIEGYNYVFDYTEEELHEFVEKTKAEYMTLPIEEIAGTISVSDLQKYQDGDGYISGTPGHVKGAILYNTLIDKMGASDKYSKIRSGDKIKIVPLTKRNPHAAFGSNSFCYLDDFPFELLDQRYVDREGNFDKYFEKPLTRVVEIAGWSTEYNPSLEDFF